MTLKEMKEKIATNYSAFKAMLSLQNNGYDEETAIVWVYRIWFE